MRVACSAGSPRSTEPARQHQRAADWPRFLLAAGGQQLVVRMPSSVVALVALDLSTQYRGLRSKVPAHWPAGGGGATSTTLRACLGAHGDCSKLRARMVLGRRTDAIAVPYAGAVSACASLPACDDMARRCEKAPASCACVGRDRRVTRLSHSCWRRSALAATALCMEAIVDAGVCGCVCGGVAASS